MGRFFFGFAALLFFFAAINVTIIPNPTAWGLVMTAIGLAIGGWSWVPWKRPAA
jgi:hypothetical protein